MKLRNIYVICKDNYSAIKHLSSERITINGRTGSRVLGWNVAREALSRSTKGKSRGCDRCCSRFFYHERFFRR